MVNEQEKTSDKIINNNICNFFCKWGDWAIINEVSCNGCSTNVYINYVAMSTVVRKFYKKSKISIYTVAFDVNYNYWFKFYF